VRLLDPIGTVRLRLSAIGDVGIIGRVRARALRDGFDAVLAPLAPALRGADLAFANLEFPLGEPDWVKAGRAPEFRHDAEVPAALVRAGVRVVSLANNHIMDCGARGLERTIAACATAGLEIAGAGMTLESACRPARFEVAGQRIVLLAYATPSENSATSVAPGFAPLEIGRVRADLERWRGEADLLIVSVHWGSMYVDYPPPRVADMADRIEALGADLVLGHHPHVLQGFRRQGRSLVMLSLGDAVLDPAAGDFEAGVASEVRADSGVFTIQLADQHGIEFEPMRLDADGVPAPADEMHAAAMVARLRRISAGLDDAATRFREESAPTLLRYELDSLKTYLRTGRLDRALKLLLALRPRHVPLLWNALTRGGAAARTPEHGDAAPPREGNSPDAHSG
jgi:Bacterial capsule synthesis protein PGA_cap